MPTGDGNIKRFLEESEVTRPQFEDFKIYHADDMTHVKAMDSDGNDIPFFSDSEDTNIYNLDGDQTDPVRNVNANKLAGTQLIFGGEGQTILGTAIDGVTYDGTTKRFGVGENLPVAKVDIVGNLLEDILNVTTGAGSLAMKMNVNGNVGFRVEPDNAFTVRSRAVAGQDNAYFGSAFNLGAGKTTAFFSATGTTEKALWGDNDGNANNSIGCQGSNTGADVVSSQKWGGKFGARGGQRPVGALGQVPGGDSIAAIESIGLHGDVSADLCLDQKAVKGTVVNITTNPDNLVAIGGSFEVALSATGANTTAIGAKLNAEGGTTNIGLWIETGEFRFDTTPVAAAGAVVGQIPINIGGAQYFIEVKQ